MQTPVGAGGNMPIDTGFLRASLRVGVAPIALATMTNPGKGKVAYDESAYAVSLSRVQIGDIVSARYLANYARRMEMGFVGEDSAGREYNQKGYGFVRLAVQRWPSIVKRVCAELKSRAS